MATKTIEQAEYDQLVKDARFIRVLRRVTDKASGHYTNILTLQPTQTFQITIDPLMRVGTQDDRNDTIDAFNTWAKPGPKA